MKFKMLALLLVCFSHTSFAFEGEIDKFFSLYEAGKFNEAVDAIYATNKWMDQKSDDIHNVKVQLQNLNSLVGDYHGKVKLGEHGLTDRLVYVSYMVLYERQPVRMEFMFYRPVNDWIIYSFSFDDEIDGELVSAGREKIAGF